MEVSVDGTEASTVDQTAFGIVPGTFGVDFAYGASDAFVAGARVALAKASTSVGDTSVDQLQLSLLGHADYVIPTGSTTRPFVGANLGVDIADGEFGADMTMTTFLFGASAGAHFFITESLSIDPRATFLYGLGSASIDNAPAGTPEPDVNVLYFALMLGVSGWM